MLSEEMSSRFYLRSTEKEGKQMMIMSKLLESC